LFCEKLIFTFAVSVVIMSDLVLLLLEIKLLFTGAG